MGYLHFIVKKISYITKHPIHTKLQTDVRTSSSIQGHFKAKHPAGREDKYRGSCVYQLSHLVCKKNILRSDRDIF